MPSVPIVMPSLMAMVLNSIGVPPAARTPALHVLGELAQVKLHGMVSVQVLAMPTIGRCEVLVGEADGLQIRARGGAIAAVVERAAAVAKVVGGHRPVIDAVTGRPQVPRDARSAPERRDLALEDRARLGRELWRGRQRRRARPPHAPPPCGRRRGSSSRALASGSRAACRRHPPPRPRARAGRSPPGRRSSAARRSSSASAATPSRGLAAGDAPGRAQAERVAVDRIARDGSRETRLERAQRRPIAARLGRPPLDHGPRRIRRAGAASATRSAIARDEPRPLGPQQRHPRLVGVRILRRARPAGSRARRPAARSRARRCRRRSGARPDRRAPPRRDAARGKSQSASRRRTR